MVSFCFFSGSHTHTHTHSCSCSIVWEHMYPTHDHMYHTLASHRIMTLTNHCILIELSSLQTGLIIRFVLPTYELFLLSTSLHDRRHSDNLCCVFVYTECIAFMEDCWEPSLSRDSLLIDILVSCVIVSKLKISHPWSILTNHLPLCKWSNNLGCISNYRSSSHVHHIAFLEDSLESYPMYTIEANHRYPNNLGLSRLKFAHHIHGGSWKSIP